MVALFRPYLATIPSGILTIVGLEGLDGSEEDVVSLKPVLESFVASRHSWAAEIKFCSMEGWAEGAPEVAAGICS
jgi:hypothetical protein